MKNIKFLICSIFSILSMVLLFSCASDGDAVAPQGSETGVGGSYARFMVVGDFMYIVDNTTIKTFNIENEADPNLVDAQDIAEGIETIFNLGDRLFIGSSTGLYLYTIAVDGIPQRQGEFLYSNFNFPIFPCDPVVANDTYAYVTLNTTAEVERCRRTEQVLVNQLNIFNVEDIQNPSLVATYDMYNPKGVGLDGKTLFLCENAQGLKIYNVEDPTNIQLIAHFDDFTAFDVIPLGGLLLVVGPDNLYQFDYSDLNNIVKVSEIPIGV